MRKTLTLTMFAIAIVSSAFAAMVFIRGRPPRLPPTVPELQHVREFVMKKGSCEFAVAYVPKERRIWSESRAFWVSVWNTKLRCISNYGGGDGINDSAGCMYSFYDSVRNIYIPVENATTFGHGAFIIAKDKKCENGGFEELLKMPIGFYGQTVESDLIGTQILTGSENLLEVVVTTKQKYLDLFNPLMERLDRARSEK